MKKFLIALAAGGAVVISAAPVLAAAYDPAGIAQREDNIRDRIAESVHDGDLSYRQAEALRSELHQIERLDARYSYDGMEDWQVRDLDSRLDLLESRVDYDVSMNTDGQQYGQGYYR